MALLRHGDKYQVTRVNGNVVITWTDDTGLADETLFSIGVDPEAASSGTEYTQSVAGEVPYPTGVLDGTLVESDAQSTEGEMPYPTGSLATTVAFTNAVAGNMLAAEGAVVKGVSTHPVGNIPAASGGIIKSIGKMLSGETPQAVADIVKHTSTSLEGEMPEENGSPNPAFSTTESVAGDMPFATGIIATVLNPIVSATKKIMKIIGSAFKKLIE